MTKENKITLEYSDYLRNIIALDDDENAFIVYNHDEIIGSVVWYNDDTITFYRSGHKWWVDIINFDNAPSVIGGCLNVNG